MLQPGHSHVLAYQIMQLRGGAALNRQTDQFQNTLTLCQIKKSAPFFTLYFHTPDTFFCYPHSRRFLLKQRSAFILFILGIGAAARVDKCGLWRRDFRLQNSKHVIRAFGSSHRHNGLPNMNHRSADVGGSWRQLLYRILSAVVPAAVFMISESVAALSLVSEVTAGFLLEARFIRFFSLGRSIQG